MARHLLSVSDFSAAELQKTLEETEGLKKSPQKYKQALSGKTLVLMFEKPSTRTRLSFECGMTRLGGHSIYFDVNTSQISRGETPADTARTISRYAHALAARVYSHRTLLEYAKHARIPVINALSDLEHPCQAIADAYTIKEVDKLDGKIVYVGDGNNVCNSLALIARALKLDFTVSCPKGYDPKLGKPTIERDPKKAVEDADIVYTDVWVSMGDEKEKAKRLKDLAPYQVNARLLSKAKKSCKVMHCLPAHRGEEITAGVLDGKQSLVFTQAENRMHTQNAILLKLVK
jgi:ornithine carbamoyltransferase